MKIYLLLGHPDDESFNGQIFDTYLKTLSDLGHDIRFQKLGKMKFDPVLWKGYKIVQELEPDLIQAQENILWCEKWIIIYPIWWGNMPAILKGFFDRTLFSGFAFKYHENDPWWDKLLKGKSAEIITTCDAPTIWIWWQYRNSDKNSIKRAILQFCGIKPVKVKRIDRVKYKGESERKRILDKLEMEIKRRYKR